MSVVIGFAGTAKNTGKTTTLNASAGILRRRGRSLLLTSIGYDGEDLDTITGLPKPRISVEKGDLVATALPLIRASGAAFRECRDTGVSSALGPVYTGVADAPGRVVLAGATSTEGVAAVLSGIEQDRVVLLDGALSRLSPMVLATHLVIATGAAKYEYSGFVTQEMDILWDVLSFPVYDGPPSCLDLPGGLYEPEQVDDAVRMVAAVGRPAKDGGVPARPVVRIAGPVNPAVVASAIAALEGTVQGLTLVFHHPVFMLLSGDASLWRSAVFEAERVGYSLAVESTARLMGFTVSPYVPRFDSERRVYAASYVAPRPFLEEIRRRTAAPCTDTVLEGTGILEGWLGEALVRPAFWDSTSGASS